MLQYVNGFSCAANSVSKELIINFTQLMPDFEDDENDSIRKNVASIIMPEEVAENLLQTLIEILDDYNDDSLIEDSEQDD